MVHKVVACVVRDAPDGPELLIFRHPTGTVQLPKGSVDLGESPREAVLRELEEESGLRDATVVSAGPKLTRRVPGGTRGAGPDQDQTWHLFHLRADPGTPDTWRHEAQGSAAEDGLVFDFEWMALSDARDALHPLYRPVVDALLDGSEGT